MSSRPSRRRCVALAAPSLRFQADAHTQHAGSTQSAQVAIDKETEVELAQITEQYTQNKDAVVKKLLDRVILVNPELHRNLKKAT